jgi:hypothetical protein
MSVGAINIALGVFVLNNLIDSMNSFRLLHYDNYQRGSLAPVR